MPMKICSVLLMPNGSKNFKTEYRMEYRSDRDLGECIGLTLAKAKELGIDITKDDVLAAHEIHISFHP